MRKNVIKRLTFSELYRMNCHEIIEAMGLRLVRDVPDEGIENDAVLLPLSNEFKEKRGNVGGYDWRLNMVVLLSNVRDDFDITDIDWEIFKFIVNNDKRWDNESICGRTTDLIDNKKCEIKVGYDRNAFVIGNKSNECFKYTKYSLGAFGDVYEILGAISGLDKDKLTDFCHYHLIDEIINIKNYYENPYHIGHDWYKSFVSEINLYLDNEGKEVIMPVWYNVKRLYAADYLLFLTVLKYVHNFNGTKFVASYFCSSYHDKEWLTQCRVEIIKRFNEWIPRVEKFPSICPQEHLFVIDNYFRKEYVKDMENAASLDGIDFFGNVALNDTIKVTLMDGKISVTIDIKSADQDNPKI